MKFSWALVGVILLWNAGMAWGQKVVATMPATMASTEPARVVPEEGARNKALTLIKTLFKDEYARKAAPDKLALAKVLLGQADETRDDAAARFVLLEQANELAIAGADPAVACAAIDAMAKYFTINVVERKVRTVLAMAPAELSPAACETLSGICMDLLDREVDADGFEMARQMADLAETAAAHSKHVSVAASLQVRLAAFRELLADYAAIQKSLTKLRENPEDSDANLAVGKFYCLSKGDFSRGLPYLANGSDPVFAPAASNDLAASGEPAREIAAADGWWEVGKNLTGTAKAHVVSHAATLYQSAMRDLSGITLLRIQGRIGNGKTSTAATLPDKPGEKKVNLLGLVDVEKDAVEGKWKVEKGSLMCEAERHARIQMPYVAPEEYDLRMVFTRTKGDGAVVILLTGGNEAFGLSLDNQGHNARIESVGRKISADNPTKVACTLENATAYALVVEVRKGSVRALLNDKVLTEHKTDYKDLSRYQVWKLKDEKLLGLGAGGSEVTFQRVEVVEVTGTGKKTR